MDKGDSEIAPPRETTVAVLPLTSAGRGRLVIGAHRQPLMRYFLSKTLAAAVVTLVALPLQESAAETRVEGIVPVRALREVREAWFQPVNVTLKHEGQPEAVLLRAGKTRRLKFLWNPAGARWTCWSRQWRRPAICRW